MSRNVRIKLKNPSSRIPDFYKDSDGGISFDLNDGTDIAITKQIDDATNIGSIRQDTVKNFDIPKTKKNRAIIGSLGNPQAFNVLHNVAFQVEIVVGNYVLPERFARIVNVADRQGFELEVTGENFGWIKPISDQKLQDIELGTFDFTIANVESAQEFDFEYVDGGTIVNFPLANYGKWPLEDRVQLEDFRPWFNVLGILQEAFCQVGWKFRCSILETSYGRRLWSYLLKEDFRDSSVSLVDKEFQAELTTNLNILNAIGCVVFDDDFTPPNGDPGTNYDATTGIYQAQVVADFFFEANLTVVSAGQPFTIFAILKIDQFGNSVRLGEQTFSPPFGTGTFPVSIQATNVEVFSTDQVCLHITSLALGTTSYTLDSGARFWNQVKSATYQAGDTLILNQLFGENYRTIDFLKGIVHLFNLKPDTNVSTKTVTFYPENGAIDFYDEGDQEAFFLPNTESKNWTDKIVCESLVEELGQKDLKNEYLFAFKETNDDGNKLLYRDLPLHSELIGQTQGDFEQGRTENFNPFFEPTRNAIDRSVAPLNPNPRAPYMPHLWDSEPEQNEALPKQAFKINPRICLAYGYDFVAVSADAAGQVNPTFGQYLKDDGTIQNEVLLFSQVLPTGISVVGESTEDEMVVYGSDIRTDLQGNYNYLYEETLRTLYFGFPIEFLILLTLNDLINFSNRDRIFFKYYSEIYGELSLFARVVKIEDFLINRKLSTPIQLLPKPKFYTLC